MTDEHTKPCSDSPYKDERHTWINVSGASFSTFPEYDVLRCIQCQWCVVRRARNPMAVDYKREPLDHRDLIVAVFKKG